MKNYRHIFFDLDRTLWDFQKNSSETLLHVLDEFDLHKVIKNQELFIEKYNFFNDRLWVYYRSGKIKKHELRQERFRMLLHHFHVDDEKLIAAISRFYLNTNPRKSALIPGAVDVLEYLSKKYTLYVISNGFYDVQLTKMISSGISRYFRKLFTSDRIGYAKPRSGIFNYAISSVNARKNESVMVGDDAINDVHGACHARIDQVFLNPEQEVIEIKPTYEIRKLEELKEIF